MALPGTSELRPQHRIGRYVVTGRIGRGGMGMVYRGYDAPLDREVAVKTLTLEGLPDEESLRRFEIEARAAARLQHPNIVTIFELGEDRGLKFIAMELLGGADLEALMRSGEPLLLEEKLEIVAQVCRGLAYAHERGIVHRDIKPSNVRVLDDGTAKLMDFGIAKLSGTNVTQAGMMVGTVHYMSPEQIRGAALDGRSDVFSLGVILHELLGGARPFPGQEPTAVLYKIVHSEPEPLQAELGPAGPRLRALLARTLAKEPERRVPGAAALEAELREVLSELGGAERPAHEGQEQAKAARRLLQEGRADEALAGLREAVAREPEALGLRRALRSLEREAQRLVQAPEPAGAEPFPELLATFQAPPTQRAPGPRTEPQSAPAAGPRAPTAAPSRPRPLPGATRLAAGALLALALLGALGFGLWRATRPVPVAKPTAPARPQPPAESARVLVESEPSGAEVALDDQPPQGRTPLELGYDPARAHRVTVRLAGHRAQQLSLAAGERPPRLRATLEEDGPRGLVALSAPYALDVSFRGRTLVKGQAQVRLSLPAGRQTLALSSARYFLRSDVSVDVPAEGEASLRVPAPGRLNVRATPDNCQVFVNGAFADYPPILDRPAASGRLAVSFRWPDGARSEETVELPPGGVAFVTGRRP